MSNQKAKIKFNYSAITKGVSVDDLIASAGESVKTMQKKVQVAAVAVLMHSQKHGDYSKANDLINAVGNGLRKKALIEFFVKYDTNLVVNEETKAFEKRGDSYDKAVVNVESAKAQPWWECAPENPWKGFNLEDELGKVLERAQKAIAKGEKEGKSNLVTIDAELMAQVQKLVMNG